MPELRRFESLTGRVKTVNMSGRALVEFDGPVDIGWYDIDPQYLTVVDAPVKKAAPEKHAAPAKAEPAKAAAGAKPAPAAAGKPAGKSPLEMARSQGAGAAVAKPAAPAAAGGAAAPAKKLSPLELARQQGAGAKAAAASPCPGSCLLRPHLPRLQLPRPLPARNFHRSKWPASRVR